MKTVLALLTSLVALHAALAGEPVREVMTNPFERPAWLSEAREVAAAPGPVKVRLDLRATLLGEPSLANVGGTILKPGDELSGYTLVAVSEGAAEFSDGERVITVTVQPPREEPDDD